MTVKKAELESNARKLVTRMLATGVVTNAESMGCTKEELATVSTDVGFPLPYSYELFLSLMGKAESKMFPVGAMFFDDLGEVYHLAGFFNSPIERWLPPDAIPICGEIMGEQVCFFLASDDPIDPPVYRSAIGADHTEKIGDSFWELMEIEMNCALEREKDE